MTSYFEFAQVECVPAKSKEYKSKKLLSLWSPPRNPTIASGATPIGSAGRAPDEKGKKRREKILKLFEQVMTKGDGKSSKYFWAYT
jgi:hypothetical protein